MTKTLEELNELLPKEYRVKTRPLRWIDVEIQIVKFRNDHWERQE